MSHLFFSEATENRLMRLTKPQLVEVIWECLGNGNILGSESKVLKDAIEAVRTQPDVYESEVAA